MGDSRAAGSKRVFGLDLVKAVAMLLVVFIHYTFYVPLYPNTLAGNLVSVLTVCGVPLFFMVNGMLLFSKRLDLGAHYRRTLRLVLVLLAWKVLSALVMWPLTGVSPLSGGLRAFVGYLLCGNLPGVNLGHFWFMYALVAIYLVFPVLKTCFDAPGGRRALMALLVVLVVAIPGMQGVENLLGVSSYYLHTPEFSVMDLAKLDLFGGYGYALMFFLAGGLFPKPAAPGAPVASAAPDAPDAAAPDVPAAEKNDASSPRRLPAAALVAAFVVAWGCLVLFQRYQAASQGVAFCVNNGYQDPLTMVMTLSAFSLMLRVPRPPAPVARLVESVGANTLGIYYVHMFVLTACAKYLCPVVPELSLWANLLLVVACYVACHAIAVLMRKVPLLRALC